jgi:hypothetical protein
MNDFITLSRQEVVISTGAGLRACDIPLLHPHNRKSRKSFLFIGRIWHTYSKFIAAFPKVLSHN